MKNIMFWVRRPLHSVRVAWVCCFLSAYQCVSSYKNKILKVHSKISQMLMFDFRAHSFKIIILSREHACAFPHLHTERRNTYINILSFDNIKLAQNINNSPKYFKLPHKNLKSSNIGFKAKIFIFSPKYWQSEFTKKIDKSSHILTKLSRNIEKIPTIRFWKAKMIILFYLITSCLLLPENYFWSQKKSAVLGCTGQYWAVLGCTGL